MKKVWIYVGHGSLTVETTVDVWEHAKKTCERAVYVQVRDCDQRVYDLRWTSIDAVQYQQ